MLVGLDVNTGLQEAGVGVCNSRVGAGVRTSRYEWGPRYSHVQICFKGVFRATIGKFRGEETNMDENLYKSYESVMSRAALISFAVPVTPP